MDCGRINTHDKWLRSTLTEFDAGFDVQIKRIR